MGILDSKKTMTVLLADDKINKYKSGDQVLFLQELTGLQELSRKVQEENINIYSFLKNKDLTPFQNPTITVKRSASIVLPLPRLIRRAHYKKYIPVGTGKFLLSIEENTKPKVIDALFDDYVLTKDQEQTLE